LTLLFNPSLQPFSSTLLFNPSLQPFSSTRLFNPSLQPCPLTPALDYNTIMTLSLTPRERITLLSAARLALQTMVKTGRMPDLELSSPGVCQIAGAFVTLTALGQIRGCVGSIESRKPLYQEIMDLVVSAAQDDPRAASITAAELHQVRIEIAILGDMRPLESSEEIEIGTTGLAVRSSPPVIMLPEAAIQNQWNPEQLLQALCRHAGLDPDSWQTGLSIYRFTTDTFAEPDE